MRNLSRWIPVLGGAVAGGVIALVIASGTGGTTKNVTTTVTTASARAVPTSLTSTGGMTINQIYKSASPGVVDIRVTAQSQNPSLGLFGGGGGTQRSEDEGSGVVYDARGDIVTDQHVVAGAISIKVAMQDGKEYPAKLLGTDASDDVGVIRIDAPQSELHPIPLADSSRAQVGDPVVAIGSPFGLPETTTSGIVSQTGRSITAPNNFTIPDAIQTDAAINPGNSGGPLLDASGHVLGLNDQIETNNSTTGGEGSSSGVGFAVPSNTVKKIADGIISGNPVKHGYVGIYLTSSPDGAEISAQGPNGTPAVAPGSPAANVGLKPGDLIMAVNGTKITSTDEFVAVVSKYGPGQAVTLTIKHNGQVKHVTIKLAVRPQQAAGGG